MSSRPVHGIVASLDQFDAGDIDYDQAMRLIEQRSQVRGQSWGSEWSDPGFVDVFNGVKRGHVGVTFACHDRQDGNRWLECFEVPETGDMN